MKAFADDNFIVAIIMVFFFFFLMVENIVGIGENFPQRFLKASLLGDFNLFPNTPFCDRPKFKEAAQK